MKLFKSKAPQPEAPKPEMSHPVPSDGENVSEKNRFGRPMLFPIFFCLISGLLLIMLESLTMRITGYVLAAALIISGIWLIICYFRSEPLVRIIESKLAIGLIALVTGTMLAFSPETLKDLLPYVWGLSLLFGGFLKIQYAFDRKSLGSEKWWILLIMAAFSLVIGTISLLNPAFLGDKREMVIGILLTFEAVLDITVYLLLRRTIQKKIAAEVPPVAVPEAGPAPAAPEEPKAPEAPVAPEAPEAPEPPAEPEA